MHPADVAGLPHIEMSWTDVEEAIANLLGQFAEAEYIPHTILGIGKGGIIPACLLHQAFKDAHFSTMTVQSYDQFLQTPPKVKGVIPFLTNDPGLLIVDDILETGATMEFVRSIYTRATFAFMVCRQSMADQCTFRGKIYEPGWVDFPWERKIAPNEVAF